MTVDQSPPKAAWFRRMLPLAGPPAATPRPAEDRSAALARFGALAALDDDQIPELTRSVLMEPDPDVPVVATLIIWHGFTNAPSQFRDVAEELRVHGYRVLLPRMPFHGESDRLTRDLAKLTEAQLIDHLHACVDIAAGFGDPVWVAGLSAGAVVAGWAAATRPEVRRLVLAAPLVAPIGFPAPLVRVFVRFPRIVPRIYWWWDPRVKSKLVGSPYAYPGFPLPGVMSFLGLSERLYDGSVRCGHDLERVILVTNPGDFAIRRDVARAFTNEVYSGSTDYRGEALVDAHLNWMHDFVDPRSPHTGTTQQVAALLLAALGTGAPAADGVLVPPLIDRQPA